ncbi:MAG TPA: hypothetical protein VM925_06805 [Labilithrix sp.]|nr:hypothetical protein [Labilithrix sp.]
MKSSLPFRATLLCAATICLVGSARAATDDDTFCSHGKEIIDEDRNYATHATRLITGDFDGDGKEDKLCKDVRKDDSNQNRLLEWLVLGNGKTPFSATWNEWCTHRNSKITTETRDDKTILVCTDQRRGRWERELP